MVDPTSQDLRRRAQTLGSYETSSFMIKLGTLAPLVELDNNEQPILKPENFDVAFHEYWHYWHNISTLAGLKGLAFTQHLRHPFQKTMLRRRDGTCAGDSELDHADRELIESISFLRLFHEGQWQPDDPVAGAWRFINHRELTDDVALPDGRAPLRAIELDVESGGSTTKFLLGALAIDESVTFALEHSLVNSFGGTQRNAPDFPYRVVPKIGEYICGATISAAAACSVGTLALLCPFPGPALIRLFEEFNKHRSGGANEEQAIERIVEMIRPEFDAKALPVVAAQFASYKKMHEARGILEAAIEDLHSLYDRAFTIRQQRGLLFDVAMFFPSVDRNAVQSHMVSFPPCDILQERALDEDEMGRDILASFVPGTRNQLTNTTLSDHLRTFQAQEHFVLAHHDRNTFVDSAAVSEPCCPFYTACLLPTRRAYPERCKNAPWATYGDDFGWCWYASAVASMLGRFKAKGQT